MDKDEITYMLDNLESFGYWLGRYREINADEITYMLDKLRYLAYWQGRNHKDPERSMQIQNQIDALKDKICDLLL